MFCANCGFQFEGNFCPQCGAKAFSAPEVVNNTALDAPKEYPPPPLGEYKASPGVLVISEKEIVVINRKKELHIPFQAIKTARYSTAPLGGSLHISWDKREIPGADIQSEKDSHLFEFMPSKFKQFKQAYDFLDEVAHINSPVAAEQDPIKLARAEAASVISPKDRIRENKKNAIACCPKCGSTSLSANKKGFGVGKAAAGAFVTGSAYGFVAGSLGGNKVLVTCLNCGHQWKL